MTQEQITSEKHERSVHENMRQGPFALGLSNSSTSGFGSNNDANHRCLSWEKAFRSYSVPIPCVTQTCAVQFLFCRTMGRGHSDAEDSTNQATVECRNPKGAVLYQVQENFPHISLFSVFRQHKHNHVSTQSTIFSTPPPLLLVVPPPQTTQP